MDFLFLPFTENFLWREGWTLESKGKAIRAAQAALGKKAKAVVILDVKDLTTITDYFVICSGESTTQVKAIKEIVEETFDDLHLNPLGIEGLKNSRWVLMDYGDIIVHIFEEETRKFYELEKLWIDAPRVPVEEYSH